MQCSLAFLISLGIFAHTRLSVALTAAAVCAVGLAVSIVIWFFRHTAATAQACFLFLCSLVGALLAYFVFFRYPAGIYAEAGQTREVSLTVEDTLSESVYASEYRVRVDGTQDIPAFRAILRCDYAAGYSRGDRVTGNVTFEEFERDINGYPERDYQLSQGVLTALRAKEGDLGTAGRKESFRFAFANARDALCDRLDRLLSPKAAGLARCLLLGDRSELSAAVRRDFRRLGLSHMLAMSGLHLTVLFGALYMLMRMLALHRSVANGILGVCLVAFMMLTAFPASLTRAGCSMILIILCYYIKKRPDPATVLCFAVALICLFDPYSAFDTGLQLSFAATLGIVTVVPLADKALSERELPRGVSKVLLALFTGVTALTFTLPISAYTYGVFSFAGVLSTLLFTLPFSAMLCLFPLTLLFGQIPAVGDLLVFASDRLTEYTVGFADWCADCCDLTVSLYYPFALWAVFGFCVVFALFVIIAPRKPLVWLAPLLIFSLVLSCGVGVYGARTQDRFQAVVCTIDQNDCIGVRSGASVGILDITNASSAPSARIRYLSRTELYATEYEYYILVNYYKKSAWFLSSLLQNEKIACVYLPADAAKENSDALERMVSGYGAQAVFYRYGETFIAGGVEYRIAQPSYLDRSKRPIHKITACAGGKTLCYLGAAYFETGQTAPQADVLIAGGYGPLYKQEFACERPIFVCNLAEEFCQGENYTVYRDRTSVILNND